MLISVLMPVFNGASTVLASVESIRAQTWSDWELIIVDDSSTDGTLAVLQTLRDSRIRLLRNARRVGLAASLNAALRASAGELIARMDADDISLPMRLQRQVEFLATHPDIDVLGSTAVFVDALGVELGVARRPEQHDDIAACMLRINPFIHPSVMMRRRFLMELGGYDESLPRAQDYDLWMRGVSRFRYHNLQEPLLRYRKAGQLSWNGAWHAARVVWRNGRRQRSAVVALWYSARHIAAFALSAARALTGVPRAPQAP